MATYVGCHKADRERQKERKRESDLSCVCGQHEFEIHSPQLFGGEISESLQSQTTQKQSCWNRKQVAAACCDYSRPQPQPQRLSLSTNPNPNLNPNPKARAIDQRPEANVLHSAVPAEGRAWREFCVKVRETFVPSPPYPTPPNYGKHFGIRNYLAVSIYLAVTPKRKALAVHTRSIVSHTTICGTYIYMVYGI